MRDGLYSVHVELGDGHVGKGSGVLVFRDGRILGGDAFLYYVGSYELAREGFTGQVTINQHTPSPGAFPLFGGREVGIGFTGTATETGGLLEGTAFVGRMSHVFRGTLRRLADAEAGG